MNLVNKVFDISKEFVDKSSYVLIVEDNLEKVAKDIKKELKDYKEFWMGYPKCIKAENGKNHEYELVAYELIAGSINYCYWYGRHDIRPNNSSSTLMYELLDESFKEAKCTFNEHFSSLCYDAITIFIKKLSLYGFPMLENRVKHLKEIQNSIKKNGVDIINTISYRSDRNELSIEELLEILVVNYPGYAGDIFLKRAFLFIMMLYRRLKWFKDEIYKVPIPADYQIPKMLKYLGCIDYSSSLREIVDTNRQILSGSQMECEIRAASIITCKKLAEETECSMTDIDTYLWLKRKECKDPFHLTITTDY